MVVEISFLYPLKLETNRHHKVKGVTMVISLFFFECYGKHFQSKIQYILMADLKMIAVLEKTNVYTNLSRSVLFPLLVSSFLPI